MKRNNFTQLDILLSTVNSALHILTAQNSIANRPYPVADKEIPVLSSSEQKLSAALMRVNHSGEVCAQALYHSQALFASAEIRQQMEASSREEMDHLAWCQQRLNELNSRTSYLNPFWYFGAFALGTLASLKGDGANLGFLNETEKQVVEHLEKHLERLPQTDHASRAIVQQMHYEEGQHAETATDLGAKELPRWIKFAMRSMSKVMTTVAHYI